MLTGTGKPRLDWIERAALLLVFGFWAVWWVAVLISMALDQRGMLTHAVTQPPIAPQSPINVTVVHQVPNYPFLSAFMDGFPVFLALSMLAFLCLGIRRWVFNRN